MAAGSRLLVVGGGLFGSQAAAYARSKGLEALVFDAHLPGRASPAAAGLFKEEWAGRRFSQHFQTAVSVLDRLYGIRRTSLLHETGQREEFLFVPPTVILEPAPIRKTVDSFGDGWIQADGQRYEGWVYLAPGAWANQLVPSFKVLGKAGAAFLFAGERAGRIRSMGPGRQAIAFVRDPGTTYFGDGTAELQFTPEHEEATLTRASNFGLTSMPLTRLFGYRPYVRGGPVFQRLGERTWLATGGRKLGTIFGAAFAHRLVEKELVS